MTIVLNVKKTIKVSVRNLWSLGKNPSDYQRHVVPFINDHNSFHGIYWQILEILQQSNLQSISSKNHSATRMGFHV